MKTLPGLATLALAAALAAPLAADSIVSTDSFLPVVHIAGATGFYVSDVSLFNPNQNATKVTFYFGRADTDSSGANGLTLTPDLQPRETYTIQDFLGTLYSTTGYGLLEVRSDLPILVTSNTLNIAANCTGGTFGQFSPGQPERNSVGFGSTNDYDLYVPGIPNDVYHRTNAVVMNPTQYTLHATMELIDGSANTIGTINTDVPPYSLHQFNDVFGSVFAGQRPPVDASYRLNFYVNTNNGATLLAYATITDVRSGDPYLITAQAQVVNVPAVRPADGATRGPSPLARPALTFTRGVPVTETAAPRK